MAIVRRPVPGRASGSISAHDFREVESESAPRRLIISLSAPEKHGKTHFALTAPGPLGVLNFDEGLEGVIGKFKEKSIKVVDFVEDRDKLREIAAGGNPKAIQSHAVEMWAKYLRNYHWALENMRSLIIDTASETWELIRLAEFGKVTQVLPHQYGPVNRVYESMIKSAYRHNCNVVHLHRMKDEYTSKVIKTAQGPKEVSEKTGKLKRIGYNAMGFVVQMNAQMQFDEEGNLEMLIVDSRHNLGLKGERIPFEMLDFATIASLVMPETSEEDWQ